MNPDQNHMRAKRKELGLTQAQVARLLGTKQSNISAYERGVLQPGSVVEQRFARMLDLHAPSIYVNGTFSTFATNAIELKNFRARNWGQTDRSASGGISPHLSQTERMRAETDLFRFMIELSDQFVHAKTATDQALFFAEPAPTGDTDIDALYAGMAAHLARNSLLERVPSWTIRRMRPASQAWFIGLPDAVSALHREAIVNGIPALRARGIFVSRRNLESV
jgi:transcriptional regulator with XRE-family HTH domain